MLAQRRHAAARRVEDEVDEHRELLERLVLDRRAHREVEVAVDGDAQLIGELVDGRAQRSDATPLGVGVRRLHASPSGQRMWISHSASPRLVQRGSSMVAVSP